jgi:hypothetical protein
MSIRTRLTSRPVKLAVAAVLAGLALTGCTNHKPADGGAQVQGQRQTEDAYAKLAKAVPYVPPANSLERRNLAERLKRTDNPNAIGYVYLLSFGKPIGYYVVKGKVSNPDSQLTTTDLVTDCSGWSTPCRVTVPAPGDDGSYGPNEGGIFFFTAEGTMVTTSLDYVWSDNPLPLDVPRLGK